MSIENIVATWRDGESELVDESKFTPGCEPGWSSWNASSPELAFCQMAAKVAASVLGTVVETGVGQGYTTRRVAKAMLPGHDLILYESNDEIREAISPWGRANLQSEPTPSKDVIKELQALIVDSAPPFRHQEIRLWAKYAKSGAVLIMHDAGNGHKETSNHCRNYALVRDLGLTGVKFGNPRGSVLAWKDTYQEWWLDLMPLQETFV